MVVKTGKKLRVRNRKKTWAGWFLNLRMKNRSSKRLVALSSTLDEHVFCGALSSKIRFIHRYFQPKKFRPKMVSSQNGFIRQVTSPVLVTLPSWSCLSEHSTFFFHRDCAHTAGFQPAFRVCAERGCGLLHHSALATGPPTKKRRKIVQSQLAPLGPEPAFWPKGEGGRSQIRASAGDSLTSDCWGHHDFQPSWHTTETCSGDTPTSRHLGTEPGNNGPLAPLLEKPPTPRHLGTQRTLVPLLEKPPTPRHLGTQRTLVPLLGTHQP